MDSRVNVTGLIAVPKEAESVDSCSCAPDAIKGDFQFAVNVVLQREGVEEEWGQGHTRDSAEEPLYGSAAAVSAWPTSSTSPQRLRSRFSQRRGLL